MTTKDLIARHRRLVAILAITAVVILGVIFLRPLIGWFSMEPTGGGASEPAATQAGNLNIEARLSPDPPRQQGNTLRLDLESADGEPVADAEVEVEVSMPAMGAMPEMRGRADVTNEGEGRYRADFDLQMGGSWTLEVRVRSAKVSGSARYNFTVGSSGLTPVGSSAVGGGGTQADTAAPDLPQVQLAPAALEGVRQAMERLEQVRLLLVADRLEGVEPHARAVGDAIRVAEKTVAGAPTEISDCIGQAARAAERLAEARALDQARLEFGEVSRFLVALAASDPRLQEGWHLFSCPMAKGYKKWFQRPKQLANPYMGTSMPTCGSSSTWEVPPAADTGAAVSHEGHGHEGDDAAFYTCSMHPSVKQKTPGTCPICSMDLTPVTWDEQEGGVVFVDEARRQRIGVRTGRVTKKPLTLEIRAVGRLAYDETRLHAVTLKQKGWITRLHVNETGQPVKKGQTLFTLYSPELYAAQQEYLLALKSQAAARKTGAPDRADSLVRAARKRLKLWDVSNAQLKRLARTGEPLEDLPIFSPASGYVIEKNVIEGAAVEPGQRLYQIAALDRIWVEADVYESDLPRIEQGQKAKITLPYLPGQELEGKVSYVHPSLERATRTGRVRIELANRNLELKPDMYANVRFQVQLGERLTIPASAVVYTGPRRLVFVDLGEGRLRPQEVKLGARAGESYEVLEGLREGQVVVTSGNFLVAAESRIRSAAEYWGGSDGAD